MVIRVEKISSNDGISNSELLSQIQIVGNGFQSLNSLKAIIIGNTLLKLALIIYGTLIKGSSNNAKI